MTRPWLAIECGGDTFSVALQGFGDDGVLTGDGGANVSTALLPAVTGLLARHGLRADQLAGVAFGCGPGSFTGVRTACAVAQGLAWGGGRLPVLPVESLMAVAERARNDAGVTDAWAAMDARMGEMYVGHYRWQVGAGWQRVGELGLVRPALACLPSGATLVGNAARVHAEALRVAGVDPDQAVETTVHAQAVLQLVPALLAQGRAVAPRDAHPLYVRDRVALTTAERAHR